MPQADRAAGAEPAETEIRDQVLTALESPAFLDRLLRTATGSASPDEKAISGARRAMVEATASPITIYPAKVRGQHRFDPDRIKINWRACTSAESGPLPEPGRRRLCDS